MTICLDKATASGQIDFYEEPMLYRCCIDVRILSRFSSANQRSPDSVKISAQIDKLNISISEKQFPMFVRLVQLFMALYYGNLKRFGENNSTPEADRNPEDLDHVIGEDDGWISWAWNSVLGEDEENPADLPSDESTAIQKEAILITLGLHLRRVLKLILIRKASANHSATKKYQFEIPFKGNSARFQNRSSSISSSSQSLSWRYWR